MRLSSCSCLGANPRRFRRGRGRAPGSKDWVIACSVLPAFLEQEVLVGSSSALFTSLLPPCLSRWFSLQSPRTPRGGRSLFQPLPHSSLPQKLQRQPLLTLLPLVSLAPHLSSLSHLSLSTHRLPQLLLRPPPPPSAWLPSLSSSGRLLLMIIMSFLVGAPLLLKILGTPLPSLGPLAPRQLFLLAVRLKMRLSSHRCRQACLFCLFSFSF